MMAEPSGSVSRVGYQRLVVIYMLGSSIHWQSSLSSHGSRKLMRSQRGGRGQRAEPGHSQDATERPTGWPCLRRSHHMARRRSDSRLLGHPR